MRLSWNEIRVRAAHFAEEWKLAHYERFETFEINHHRVASFGEQ